MGNLLFVNGVDTGGTFTDGVAVDARRRMPIGKRPSTPPLAGGVLQSLRAMVDDPRLLRKDCCTARDSSWVISAASILFTKALFSGLTRLPEDRGAWTRSLALFLCDPRQAKAQSEMVPLLS